MIRITISDKNGVLLQDLIISQENEGWFGLVMDAVEKGHTVTIKPE